jgi:hypothetical protein
MKDKICSLFYIYPPVKMDLTALSRLIASLTMAVPLISVYAYYLPGNISKWQRKPVIGLG